MLGKLKKKIKHGIEKQKETRANENSIYREAYDKELKKQKANQIRLAARKNARVPR